jgi:hypothetical protein
MAGSGLFSLPKGVKGTNYQKLQLPNDNRLDHQIHNHPACVTAFDRLDHNPKQIGSHPMDSIPPPGSSRCS